MADAASASACFSGTYAHTLDAKGRVSLPAKFRKDLPVSLKLVPRDGVIHLFSVDDYNEWVREFFPERDGKVLTKTRDELKLMTSLTAHVEDTEIDTAGRICISPALREMAGLEKEVKVVGLFSHVAIMSPAMYAELDGSPDADEG